MSSARKLGVEQHAEEERLSSDEEEEGSEYDYGWDDGDDDEDYELDFSGANVSSDILRMLGASEEKIAAVKAANATDWRPPDETGLQNSAAIAAFDDVALKAGDKEGAPIAAKTPLVADTAIKVKTKALEAVPAERVAALPPAPAPRPAATSGARDGSNAENNSGDEDEDWDEASWASWSDVDSDAEPESLQNMSPNLLRAIGRPDLAASADAAAAGSDIWIPPATSGVGNSARIIFLAPMTVGLSKPLESRFRGKSDSGSGHKSGGGGGSDEDDGSCSSWGTGGSDDEYDYETVDDDTYMKNFGTALSANLQELMFAQDRNRSIASQINIDWRPPQTSGLGNSAPILVLQPAKHQQTQEKTAKHRQAQKGTAAVVARAAEHAKAKPG